MKKRIFSLIAGLLLIPSLAFAGCPNNLLLHLNDSTTSVTDYSDAAHVMSCTGSATQSSSVAKFGTGSGDIDAGTIVSDAGMGPGTQDFDIDWWSYWTGTGTQAPIWSNGFVAGFECDYVAGNLQLYVTGSLVFNTAYSPTTSAWHHIEISRTSGTIYVWTDGNALGSSFSNSSNISSSFNFTIGDSNRSPDRNVDEFRYIIGTGGHTTSFTPNTTAYCGPTTNCSFLGLMD